MILVPLISRTARQNDEAYEENLLYTVTQRLDTLQEEAGDLVDKLENTEWIHDLFIEHHLQGMVIKGKMKTDIIRELSLWVAQDSNIQQISFQFHNAGDELYSSNGVYSNLWFYHSFAEENVQYRFFYGSNGFSTVSFAGQEYLLYYMPFTDIVGGSNKGAMNVLYKVDGVGKELTLSTAGDVVRFRMLDGEGKLLWEYTARETEEETITLRGNSNMSDYQYEIIVPLSVHNRTTNRITPILWLTVGLNLLFCCAVAGYFALSNYQPIQSIIHKFVGESAEGNEFHVLDMTMNRLLKESSEAKTVLDRLQPLARQNLLGAMLSGTLYYSDTVSGQLHSCDISFEYPLFNVLAVHAPFSTMENEKEAYLEMELLVSSSRTGLAVNAYVFYEDDDRYQILLNYKDQAAGSVFLECMEKECVAYFQEEESSLTPHIGVGSAVKNSSNVYACSEQAHIALNFAMLNNTGNVVRHREIAQQLSNHYSYPFSTELLLSRTIQDGNAENAKVLLDGIIQDNLGQHLSVASLQALNGDLISTLFRSMQSIGISQDYQAYQMPKIASLADVQRHVEEKIDEACNLVRTRQLEAVVVDVDQQILDYVDQSLYEQGLSLNSIAEAFHKSPAYISQLYKRKRDTNYNDYVNRARIQRAVELMVNEKVGVNEVYTMVGYVSITTFRRNFIKYTNQSPSEFGKQT